MEISQEEIAKSTNETVSLDSISVCAEDMDKTAAFLTEIMGWQRHPKEFTFSGESGNKSSNAVFFDGNGCLLQLVAADTDTGNQGNGNNNGDFYKLNFIATHAETLVKRIASDVENVSPNSPVAIHQQPMVSTRDVSSQLNYGWHHQETDPNVPRIDRVAIVVEDIEVSVRFYTEHLGLRLHPMSVGIDSNANKDIGGFRPAFIFANSIWLVLIQPTGAGPLMDSLKAKGNGQVLEVITEVDDLEVFYDRMAAKNISLVCVDGKTPLSKNMKSQLLAPHGDRLAYIPTDVSQGMVIEVFQRGPHATSLIHQRDATFR